MTLDFFHSTNPLLWLLCSPQKRGRLWHNYSMTWFGRIKMLKMNILPRIIYLLYTILTLLPQVFFKRLNQSFLKFFWHGNQPRFTYDILCRHKRDGGTGLPNVFLYYKAIKLVCILNWTRDASTKLWVPLEKTLACGNLTGAPWIQVGDRGLSDWTSSLTRVTLTGHPL